MWGTVLERKTGSNVVGFIRKLCKEGKKPEDIITDNGKEFINEDFRRFCRSLEIKHRQVSVEAHRSNGRIERVIGTLRESILKSEKETFREKVMSSIERYNRSYHTGIKRTPIEALEDKTGHVMIENSPQGNYGKKFKKTKREKFEKGQTVRVAKRENLSGCSKYEKGRFLETGKILEKCGNDSYLVKLGNGRLVEKIDYDLKNML